MRKIKFRGLHYNPRTKETKWVYGDLVFNRYINSGMDKEGTTTIESREDDKLQCYRVPIKSVGQFTGLKDKNGEDIYEGNIVQISDIIGEILFVEELAGFDFQTREDIDWWGKDWRNRKLKTEVIGNKFENPELLKCQQ